jgi:NAD(P)H-flavin reductase
VKDESDRPLLFIATGTGIAPIRSMILHRLALFQTGITPQPMTLIWGLRREEDRYYQETFSTLAQHDSTFNFIPTLSQPSSGWRGKRGRVTAWLPEFLSGFLPSGESAPLSAYLCGSGAMIKEVRAILTEKGLPKAAIHSERFFS